MRFLRRERHVCFAKIVDTTGAHQMSRRGVQKRLDPLSMYGTVIEILIRFKERHEKIKGKVGIVLEANLPRKGETPVPSSWPAPSGTHWFAYDGTNYVHVSSVRLVPD